mgnify:CR=1 FL=1
MDVTPYTQKCSCVHIENQGLTIKQKTHISDN